MNTPTPAKIRTAHDMAGLEARFGLRVGSALSERALASHPDIQERLRFAREQALARAQAQRAVASSPQRAAAMFHLAGGQAALGGPAAPWWGRLASALPLLLLLASLYLIDDWHDRMQTSTVAEVDAALLADDLPPDAYSDPGFEEYLKAGAH